MKNFSSKTRVNSHHSFERRTVVKVLILLVTAVLVLVFFRGIAGNAASFVTTPLFEIRNWFLESSATVPSYFRDRDVLIDRIRILERRLLELDARNVAFEKTRTENERLRTLLGATSTTRTAAGVIARPPNMPYDALLVDRGRNQGIQEGAVVYHINNRVIGYVAKVYQNSALITLLTTPKVESTVYILGPDIYTKAYGEGGGVLRVSVPQGVPLSTDDIVVLPSLAAGLVGSIDAIESVATRPEQNAFVTFETPISSFQFVSISNTVPEQVSFQDAQSIVKTVRPQFLDVNVPDEVIVETATSSAATTTGSDAPETSVRTGTAPIEE